MHLPIRLGVAVSALVLSLVLPVVAVAAPLTDVWGAGAVSVLDLDAGKEPTYVVTLIFSDELDGPPKEQVGVPIPAGSTVIWAGEILSDDPAEDITAADLDTVEIDGQNYAVFTVTKASRVQVECSVPEEVLTGDGERIELNLEFTAPSDMAGLQLAVVAPPGSRAEEVPEGVQTTPISSGTAYVRNLEDVNAGTETDLILVLVPGMPVFDTETTATAPATESAVATAPVEGADSGVVDSSVVPYIIGGLVVLILIAIGALVVIRRREDSAEE